MADMGSSEPATKGDLDQTRRLLAREIVKLDAKIDRVDEGLRAEMKAWGSRIVKTVEDYSGQVGKVDRAQIIADWRLRELEKRVGTLETL